MTDYLTLEDLATRNEKDIPVYEDWDQETDQDDWGEEIGMVRIRAIDETVLIQIFDRHGMDIPEAGEELDFSPSENVDLIDSVLSRAMVNPEVETESDLDALIGQKSYFFMEVLSLSGLAEVTDDEASFQEDSEE